MVFDSEKVTPTATRPGTAVDFMAVRGNYSHKDLYLNRSEICCFDNMVVGLMFKRCHS